MTAPENTQQTAAAPTVVSHSAQRRESCATDGKYIMAPVENRGDLVELLAVISFLNTVIVANDPNPGAVRLEANSVFTYREPRKWRATAFIAFMPVCGVLPKVLQNRQTFSAYEGSYAVRIVDELPAERHNNFDVTRKGKASDVESLHSAVTSVAHLISEDVNSHSESFRDAVASRFRFFARQFLASSAKSPPPSSPPASPPATPPATPSPTVAASQQTTVGTWQATVGTWQTESYQPQQTWPPLPPGPPPRTTSKRKAPVAFKKPYFRKAEDLFYAFATHTNDTPTGHGRPLRPFEVVENMQCCQAFVFYHPSYITGH